MRIAFVVVALTLLGSIPAAQTTDSGRTTFVNRCAGCHGTDGNGGELGPAIATRVPTLSDQDLTSLLRDGRPALGMPPFASLTPTESTDLIRHLRTIKPRVGFTPTRTTLKADNGRSIEGLIFNQSLTDVQLLGNDGKLRLLRSGPSGYRQVTSQSDWASYNGGMNGSRYSQLSQINRMNVGTLAPKWIYSLNTARLQVTPVVVEGVMYVTSANECYALDAGSGREIWRYQRPRTKGLIGNAAGGVNRGVGVAGDRVFMVTDHAHIIALNRHTGSLLWETEMADWRQNYNATGAPLRSAISSSPEHPAAMKACADSWPPSIRPRARKRGGSGPCRLPVSRVQKPGRARASHIPAARRG